MTYHLRLTIWNVINVKWDDDEGKGADKGEMKIVSPILSYPFFIIQLIHVTKHSSLDRFL